ncbi:threonine/serine exporter family protein [uncultured Fusobacterium sp.]|uniref:threonine/serine exporter family protein n=1 Tax=uncultured Fusobacterium sp. TaxID=159267 RepID=UPI0025D585FA|nr:threonine/serine exporter family protein [uncultured Fusobacterium sp.]
MISENKILILANLTGKIALQSGAETYRVEDIITRICKHYGLNAQCFVSITCIITSVRNYKGELFCSVERIQSRTTNLNKIHCINQLVRDIKKYNFDEFAKKLTSIDREIPYNKSIYFFAYCIGAFFFALLGGGNLHDAISASLGGGIIFLISSLANKLQANNFFINILGGFICTLSSYISFKLHFTDTVSYSTIGTIMLLVPGIALTNAVRDLVAGDLLSGLSRAAEAFLIGAALASGTGIALFILLKLEGI